MYKKKSVKSNAWSSTISLHKMTLNNDLIFFSKLFKYHVFSISCKKDCSRVNADDFGYVIVHKIIFLLVLNMLTFFYRFKP